MTEEFFKHLENKALWVRRKVLEIAVKAGNGHISTAFSQAEMLVALYYGGLLRFLPRDPKWSERDRFILSKGQGGLGLYPILADVGYFPLQELDIFAQRGSILGVHSEWNVPGIEVITGSLGHGLPMATGMLLAARSRGEDHFVVVMVGDGELYEGSNWEALFTATHQCLGRLILIVDKNGGATIGKLNGDGPADGPGQGSLRDKFEDFGFDTQTVDGHSFRQIFEAFVGYRERPAVGKPLCIVSLTKKGKGARIMESGEFFPNHYRVPRGDDLRSVLADLGLDPEQFKARVGEAGAGY